jgi:hypothetical protein
MRNIWKSTKGAINIVQTLVEVVLVVALIPIIAVFIANATNLTATEETLLGLVTLFIVLALVFGIVKSSGLTNQG